MKYHLQQLMFSSLQSDWRTPEDFYKQLDVEFHFNFDPCPTDPTWDGLVIPWKERNFINPPYGREIGKWIRKAWIESRSGKLCVLLLPARTDTRWFWDYCTKGEIRFIRGRLKFNPRVLTTDKPTSAPFPSMVVIFQ